MNIKNLIHANYSYLEFELTSITTLDSRQLETIRQWRNHPGIRQWLYSQHMISAAEHLEFVQNLKQDLKNGYWLVSQAQEHLGVISLNHIHVLHRHAHLGLYGNPDNAQKGKGQRCLKSLLYLAFDVFQLHVLRLEVFKNNEPAIKLYQKMGFEIEGCLRDYALFQGHFQDVLIMSILSENKNLN